MAAGKAGGARLDQGTLSLRLALLHAEEDSDRLRALEELANGKVLAATWPNSPEAVRTLTNSDGEQAMPLFSGLDTLQSAARRFGWINPDGSFAFCELPAREALQSALSQGAHYVVLDIYADHATEFARHEIAQVLQLTPRAQAQPAARAAQAGAAQPQTRVHEKPSGGRAAPVGSRPQPGLAEIDMPFARQHGATSSRETMRNALAALDEASRRDAPRAQPQARAAAPVAAARVEVHPAPQPVAAPPPPPAPIAPVAQPARPQALEELPAFGGESDAFPLADAGSASSFGFSYDEPEPEARPAALEAAAMVAQVGKLGDAETQKAAAEVAAMLKDMARKGTSEDEKPSPTQSAAKTLASLLTAEVAADAARSKRGRQARAAEAEPESNASAGDTQPNMAAAEATAGGLGALEAPLSDALLDGVAEALRQFPEVEWACAVSDGSALPALALRVDPGFQTRAGEIKAAALAAAQARGGKVSVLLLSDPQQVRDARAHGSAFFPWRKRAAKR